MAWPKPRPKLRPVEPPAPRLTRPLPPPEERRRIVEDILKLPAGFIAASEAFAAAREDIKRRGRLAQEEARRRSAREEMERIVKAFAPRRGEEDH